MALAVLEMWFCSSSAYTHTKNLVSVPTSVFLKGAGKDVGK